MPQQMQVERPSTIGCRHFEGATRAEVQRFVTTLRTITLQLDPDEYWWLEREAERRGVPPPTLVRMWLRATPTGSAFPSIS